MSRGSAGGDAAGKASISVAGDLQEFSLTASKLNVRTQYRLFINGVAVGFPGQPAQLPSSSLGTLRILLSTEPGKPQLPADLNPVTGIRQVELKDGSGGIVLQGTFEVAAVAPRIQQREAQLVSTGVIPQAGGKAFAVAEALPSGNPRELFKVRAENLLAGQLYRVVVDGFSFEVTLPSRFIEVTFSSDGSIGQTLPAALRPVLERRNVAILDAGGRPLLQGSFPNVSQPIRR